MSVAEDGRLSWVSSLRMAALTVDAIDISVAGNDC